MNNPEPFTEARGRALKAAVCQPHLNLNGVKAQGIDPKLYRGYWLMRRSSGFRDWLGREAWLWRQDSLILAPRCSFCKKKNLAVRVLISGPLLQSNICNECIETCNEIIAEREAQANE